MRPFHLAYEAGQANIPCTDVTLVLGEYQWKVHSKLLTSNSDFFKKALEGNFEEASTRRITLHDDNPWAIARIIQYLYIGTWSASQDVFTKSDDDDDDDVSELGHTETFTSSRVMRHNQYVKSFREDKKADSDKPCLEILVMVVNTADKYLMTDLIDRVPCQQVWHKCIKEAGVYTFAHTLLEQVKRERISKYSFFRSEFASVACEHTDFLTEYRLQDWYADDAWFASDLVQACADKMYKYHKRIENLEKELSNKSSEASSKIPAKKSAKKRKRAN